jgi:hypothetical protein
MTAFKSIKDINHVFVGGYDIATATGNIDFSGECTLQEFRPCGTTFPLAIDTGTRTGTLACSGLLDPPTTDAVSAINGTGRVVSLLLEGDTITAHAGPRFWGLQSAMVSGVKPAASPDQVDALEETFTANGECNYGWVVAPHAARTTAGNTETTYADIGAAATGGGHAYLHVTALSLGNHSSLTVNFEHSSDHVTYADVPFTNLTAVGAEVKNIATTVNRYVAMSWSWNGGSPGAETFSGFCGVTVD